MISDVSDESPSVDALSIPDITKDMIKYLDRHYNIASPCYPLQLVPGIKESVPLRN
jgi:hypothetical protein